MAAPTIGLPRRSALLPLGLASVLFLTLQTMPSGEIGDPSLVSDINPGTASSFTGSNGIAVGSVLFFSANDGATGFELWRSDGTIAGTMLVKDIFPGTTGSVPLSFADLNGTLFFAAADGVHGRELWKSDGTSAGTVLVKDIRAGSADGGGNPTNLNGTLLFFANDGITGIELWKSDGTEAGTVLVKDSVPGSGGLSGGGPVPVNVNGTLYFAASDSVSGNELWKSDGTAAGTGLVKDILPGSFGSNPTLLTDVSGTLFFVANDGVHGAELWKSDGTAAGTVLVRDIRSGSAGASTTSRVSLDGNLFFNANDGTSGIELWKSDGTFDGTVRVMDIRPGTGAANPINFGSGGGLVFFAADDGVHGYEVWRTDGTAAGTLLVKDIHPGATQSSPSLFTDVRGTLFFNAHDDLTGAELWQTDGTASGTVLVTDIRPGSAESSPLGLIDVDGTLFFWADDGIHGREPWAFVPIAVNAPPVANAGADQVIECAGPSSGTIVSLDGSLSSDPNNDPLNYEWRDAEGAVIGTTATVDLRKPLGVYEFTLKVNDGHGGFSDDAVTVVVGDTTAPGFLNVPGPITVTQTSPAGTPVTVPMPTPSDVCDLAPTISSTAPPLFPAGDTEVTFTAIDASENRGTISITVFVNQPPVANAGLDQTIEATSPTGVTFALDGTGSSDPEGGELTYFWSWASGTSNAVMPLITLPAGSSQPITLTVRDVHGATATDVVNLIVTDTTPPAISLLGANPQTVERCSTYDDPGVAAFDIVDLDLTRSIATLGTVNPAVAGTYILTYTVADASGNSASVLRTVHVADTTAPAITGMAVDSPMLWPADHKLVDVIVNYDAADGCSGLVTTSLNVSSNEPQNGTGDGDTSPDWVVVDDRLVRLRAERAGSGSGRVYIITVAATDASGNSTTRSVTVAVPHNR